MAFSTSLKRSQDVIACQLCETSTNIKVKCLECDLLLCEQCKNKTHLKFKNADSHTVVPLKDIGLYTENESKELKQVKCTEHPQKVCCMYCDKCSKLVCPKCISSGHQKHDLMDIETVCQNKIDYLVNLHGEIDAKTGNLLTDFHKLKSFENSKYLTIQQQILDEEKRVIDDIHRMYADRLDELAIENEHIGKLISDKEESISKEKKIIDQQFREFNNHVKAGCPDRILEGSHILESKINKFPWIESVQSRYTWKSLRYVSGEIITKKEPAIGILETELKLVATYDTDYMTSLTTDAERSLLMLTDKTNICRFDYQNMQSKENRFLLTDKIMEIKCLNAYSILMTTGSKVKFLEVSSGKVKELKDLSPNIPATLHVTKTNKIVVGMDHRELQDKEYNPVIVILTNDGKKIGEFLNSEENELLMNDLVRSCTSLRDETLCFIDSDWDDTIKDRVVKLNDKGKIQWIYSGTPGVYTNEMQFTPTEVLCTESDNIILSDKFASMLHVLTNAGSLIFLINLHFLKIDMVGVMVLDKEKQMWLHDNGKLHCVSFNGF